MESYSQEYLLFLFAQMCYILLLSNYCLFSTQLLASFFFERQTFMEISILAVSINNSYILNL